MVLWYVIAMSCGMWWLYAFLWRRLLEFEWHSSQEEIKQSQTTYLGRKPGYCRMLVCGFWKVSGHCSDVDGGPWSISKRNEVVFDQCPEGHFLSKLGHTMSENLGLNHFFSRDVACDSFFSSADDLFLRKRQSCKRLQFWPK